MADSSANSIARKCRKLDSIVVTVKSDQADTPLDEPEVIPQILGECRPSRLHLSAGWGEREEGVAKEITPN